MANSQQFNGTNLFTAGTGTAFQGLSAITIAAWVFRPTTGTFNIAFSVGSGTTHVVGLYFWSDNAIYLDIRNGATVYGSASSITNTGWVFIAGTFNAGVYSIFTGDGDTITPRTTTRTGVPAPTTTSSSISADTLQLGRLTFAGTQFSSNGSRQAHTMAFNAELSADLLKYAMQQPHKVAALSSCLSYWPLDINGTTQVDECGRQNATGVSSPTFSTSSPPTWYGRGG